MRLPLILSIIGLILIGSAISLVGCQPRPPKITKEDLETARRAAYEEGFIDCRTMYVTEYKDRAETSIHWVELADQLSHAKIVGGSNRSEAEKQLSKMTLMNHLQFMALDPWFKPLPEYKSYRDTTDIPTKTETQ